MRSVTVDGVELGRGSRVVVRPREGGDVLDLALAGRVAVVAAIEEDLEGGVQLAVTLEDDPGRDLGDARRPGHRFYFSPGEVEPLAGGAPPAARILVAGVGNVFLGDDGFGVELARRLAERELPAGVEVVDFGIRGMDLVYTLGEDYDAVVFLDATPRGEPAGTLYLIEPELEAGEPTLDAHGMDPVKVMRLARELGPAPERMLVLGCEPATVVTGEEDEIVAELSAPVRAALDDAVALVESLLAELAAGPDQERRRE